MRVRAIVCSPWLVKFRGIVNRNRFGPCRASRRRVTDKRRRRSTSATHLSRGYNRYPEFPVVALGTQTETYRGTRRSSSLTCPFPPHSVLLNALYSSTCASLDNRSKRAIYRAASAKEGGEEAERARLARPASFARLDSCLSLACIACTRRHPRKTDNARCTRRSSSPPIAHEIATRHARKRARRLTFAFASRESRSA